MLRICQQSSANAARHYYSAADYYAEGRETQGQWAGRGAALLGLAGNVEKQQFDRLCDNLHPKEGGPLTARRKDDRTVGYDFTFSVPKSVSLLQALTNDEAILQAFRDSVRETMLDLEAEMKVRVRQKGQNTETVTGNLVWAEFTHFTSRPVDGVPCPHLHAHCFAFNASYNAEENAWRAGYFRDLKRDAGVHQAAFRARLANRLQALGYTLETKKGDFEIAGLSPAVLKRFARRTEQIEELAAKLGIQSPEAKAKLGATSREAKNTKLTWDELLADWRGRLSAAEHDALERIHRERAARTPQQGKERESVTFALDHCFERSSVVSEKRLLAEALQHGLGEVTVEGVRAELARRQLIVRERDGQRLVTTPEILREEEAILAFARKGRGTRKPLAPGHVIKRDWLNAGQRQAVLHILNSRDRLAGLIRGVAGSGKTSLLQEAVEAIRENGHEVIVLAPSASASRDTLRSEGFENADTVASLLASEPKQNEAAGQVILVDEAGLLGARDMARLFAVAERQDARVVLLGDRMQHGSVSRGSVLRQLEEQAGVPSVAVTQIMRQKDESYRKAVHLLSQGKTVAGFDALDRLGWIDEVPTEDRYQQLAKAYLDATSQKKPGKAKATALVVSPTWAEAERITQAIRTQLQTQGQLGPEREVTVWQPLHLTEAERSQASSYQRGDLLVFHQNAKGYRNGTRLVDTGQDLPLDQAQRFTVYRPATIRLAVGDRVRITANTKSRDGRKRLSNGAMHTVAKFTPKGDLVLDNGWTVDRDRAHLTHGYTVTSHNSQSRTVDHVLIGQSSLSWGASSAEQFYVSASRGKESARIFTDDKQALRAAIQRRDERLTATELVRGQRASRARMGWHLSQMRRHAAEWGQRALEAERTRTPVYQRTAHER